MPNPTYQGTIKPSGLKGLQGLRSWGELSQEEQSSWLESHPHAKNYSPTKRSIAYRNNNYLETLGQPAFDAYDIETLDQMYRDKIVGDAFNKYYKDDSNFNALTGLTTEGKQELLESGYLNETDTQKDIDNFKERYEKASKSKAADILSTSGDPIIDISRQQARELAPDYDVQVNNSRQEKLTQVLTKDNDRKKEMALPEINELSQFYHTEQNAWIEANSMFKNLFSDSAKEGSLDDVISYMADNFLINERHEETLKRLPTEEKANYVGQILAESEFNPSRIDNLFNQISEERTIEYETPFGPTSITLPGSATYRQLGSTDRFNNFTAEDKLDAYLTYQVMSDKYGTSDAISNLETSLLRYAKEHEGTKEWVSDVLLNVTLGGIANIMNKVNAVNNIAVLNKYGQQGLSNVLEGKNADGTDREQNSNTAIGWMWDNALNPHYWNKVDEYNTLDPLEIAKADENSGISPYIKNRIPGEKLRFISDDTVREALKMTKFVWSDYLMGQILGGVTKGATGLTTKLAGAKAAGIVNKAGAIGTVLASGMGIAESYGVMTYDQTKQELTESLDRELDKRAATYAGNLRSDPERQKEIDAVTEQQLVRLTLQAQISGTVPPSKEEVRKAVEQDFLNYHKQSWYDSDEGKALKAEGEQVAQRAATNAYMVDATIEEIRMASSNFAFRKYLFDKGTLKALGDNSRTYTGVDVMEDGTLTPINKVLNRAKSTLKPFWGGFQSNYFDDVTVGFGKGFGLGQYNAWLQNKFDASKAAAASDLPFSFLDGLNAATKGATEALYDRQSFYDGFVGALGSFTSATPRTVSERAAALESMGKTAQDNLTFLEKVNKRVMNPLLDAYYNSVGNEGRTARDLEKVNEVLANKKDAINGIVNTVIRLNATAEANQSDSMLDRKGAKQNEAFQLMYELNGMTSSTLIKKSPLVQEVGKDIDRLASGRATDEEVAQMMNQPGNKGMSEQEARDRLKKNAKTLKDMSERIAEAGLIVNQGILGQNIDNNTKEELIYHLAMDKTWQQQANEMEETISGGKPMTNVHSAVALYGNKREFDRNVLAQGEKLQRLKRDIEISRNNLKVANDLYNKVKNDRKADPEIVERLRTDLLRHQLDYQTAIETAREAENLSKQMKKDAAIFENEEVPVLSSEAILKLSPEERAVILNKENYKNYSTEQQVEIDKALADVRTRNTGAEALVADSGELATRIKDNKKAYNRMLSNPEAATAYVTSILKSREHHLAEVFAQRRIDTAFEAFDKAQSKDELTAIAKEVLNSKELGIKSAHIKEYMSRHPENNEVMQGFLDVSKLREDAFNAIKSVIAPSERPAYQELIVHATRNTVTEADAMAFLENILDSQIDATAKLQFDRVLEEMKKLGHQRDATIIRNREEERKRKQEAEAQRLLEEEKKSGKKYGWDGYKIGDTIYSKQSGKAAEISGFEDEDIMVLAIPVATKQGTGIEYRRYHAAKSKDLFSKEKPVIKAKEEPKQKFNETLLVDISQDRNPENPNVTLNSAENVDLTVDSEGKINSPSAEQQAAKNNSTVVEVPKADPTDQGNSINERSSDIVSGTRLSEYSISALKDGVVIKEQPREEGNAFSEFVTWLNNTNTKLQDIIDNEFGQMLVDNPDTKIQFMMMKPSEQYKHLASMLFNVVELTPSLRQKYHSDERGGVIQANGKSWLVVGITGFDSKATDAERKSYDATMKGPISKRRYAYFNENTSESYYVDPVAHTLVQNTTSGRIVNQREGAEAPRLKKVSELASSAGVPMNKVGFGIQTKQVDGNKGFVVTKNVQKGIKVFPPRNVEDNRGRAFILLDTPNGNKIPGMIEPTMYNTLAEDSPLKDMIDATIAELFSTKYEVREDAVKRLCGLLVLDNKKNILIGTKDLGTITIRQEGFPDITQKLGKNFDSIKFFKDLQATNFQINVTLNTLENPSLLKIYDESGALMTTVDSMRTVGMSYTIYKVDSSGNPIKVTPIGNAIPGTGVSEIPRKKGVRVNNTMYDRRSDGQFVNRYDGTLVPRGSELETSCVYNQIIDEGSAVFVTSKENEKYYNVPTPDGNTAMVKRDNLGNIKFLKQADSERINKEMQEKSLNRARENNLKDVDLGDNITEKPKAAPTEEETLTDDQIVEQLLGNFDSPKVEVEQDKPKEILEEAKQVKEPQTKEIITDLGIKPLTDLQKTEKTFTFVDIASNFDYMETLYQVLEGKNWGITGDFSKDSEILKSHNIPVTNVTNIDAWLDLIKNCR